MTSADWEKEAVSFANSKMAEIHASIVQAFIRGAERGIQEAQKILKSVPPVRTDD